jgi:hypothetical protein
MGDNDRSSSDPCEWSLGPFNTNHTLDCLQRCLPGLREGRRQEDMEYLTLLLDRLHTRDSRRSCRCVPMLRFEADPVEDIDRTLRRRQLESFSLNCCSLRAYERSSFRGSKATTIQISRSYEYLERSYEYLEPSGLDKRKCDRASCYDVFRTGSRTAQAEYYANATRCSLYSV